MLVLLLTFGFLHADTFDENATICKVTQPFADGFIHRSVDMTVNDRHC